MQISLKFKAIPILENQQMEDQALPSIRDMYNVTRQNFDYNVIKVYDAKPKLFAINSKPTKKDHYLDYEIKLNSSPGPASTANKQLQWAKKNSFQVRRAEKQTYLDEIYRKEKKANSPSPHHYSISLPWPKKRDQLKNISEKTNFADTCQYSSDQIPGPGTYNVRTHIGTAKENKKIQPHAPLRASQQIAAEVGSYSPCPLQYNTFTRYQLLKSPSQPNLDKKALKFGHPSKQNLSPGPAAYSTVSFWPGKSPPKKKEVNYFRYLSKGINPGIYH